MSSSFFERRKDQLKIEGREDLVIKMENPDDSSVELEGRSLDEVLAFVQGVIGNIYFDKLHDAYTFNNRETYGMTVEDRENALRRATITDLRERPLFYSILLEKVRKDHDEDLQKLIGKVDALDIRLKERFPPVGIAAKKADMILVEFMDLPAAQKRLEEMTSDDFHNRPHFYTALLNRLRDLTSY